MAASELPGATVTFLFTDIEGGAPRGRERERLLSVIERHDGTSVAASGEGFLAVFRSAAAAVAAAAEARQAVGPDLAGMGLHSDEDAADTAMRLAASIAAAAQRREVLLSGATARLVAGVLPARARLRDAGVRGLPGRERPERLFALELSGAEAAPRRAVLLEREADLASLLALVDSARDGDGGLAAVEGSAGIGKTRLLSEVRAAAAARGLRVLRARGGELEREFAFGIVRQLLEPVLATAGVEERAELFAGAAGLAAAIFGERGLVDASAGGDDFALLHGLYWLAANLALNRPTVALVDDAQWADGPSLRWLGHVARRLEGLPMTLVIATRPPQQSDQSALLTELLTDPGALVLRPCALGLESVATLAHEAFSAAPDAEFCSACLAATGGNPLYLQALLRTLAADGVAPAAEAARLVQDVGPEPVARAVSLRLARLPASATALARAVAVLGPLSDLGLATALAELERPAATAAAAALSRAELLRPEPVLELTHPVVRAAIYEAIEPIDRAELHRRAARLLAATAEPERAAAHILLVPPAGDPSVGLTLRAAAARARGRGAAEEAAIYLRRALAEGPAGSERGELLADLGLLEIGLDMSAATAHLQAAVALVPADRFIDVGAECGRVLAIAGRCDEAADMLEAVIERARATRRDIAELATGDFISATWWEPALYPRALAVLEALDEEQLAGGLGSDVLLATLAQHTQSRFDRPASVALATRSLASGLLVDRSSHALFYALDALRAAGEFDASAAAYRAALDAARRRGDVLHVGGLLSFRGWLETDRGDLRAAEPDLREGLAFGLERGELIHAMYHAVFLTNFLLERGELEEAARVLALPGLGEQVPGYFGFAFFLDARGMLRLAQRKPDDALRDFETIGRMAAAVNLHNPALLSWRSHAAAALYALGREREARERAAEELELALRWGAPLPIGRALRTLGLVEAGAAAEHRLREAVDVLAASPVRLEYAKALVDLGAALRRRNERRAAQALLKQGVELAHESYASALATRANQELAATGARPRKLLLTGVTSLTASERRVAQLAAEELSNKEIAQALFVTVKTVEVHLSNVYRKLEITSRRQIAAALVSASHEALTVGA